MSTGALLAIIAAAIIVTAVAVIVVRLLGENRVAERARIERDARDHRVQAEAGVTRARALGTEADRHRAEAERHAQLADEHSQQADEHARAAAELQDGIKRAGAAAGRHDERAAELERKLA